MKDIIQAMRDTRDARRNNGITDSEIISAVILVASVNISESNEKIADALNRIAAALETYWRAASIRLP